MSTKFAEYKGLNLPNVANEILTYWEENHLAQKSLTIGEVAEPYVFFEEIFDFYEEKVGVPDLKALITGHNIVSSEGKVLSIANRYFIDTGAFLKEPFYNKKGEVIKPLKDNKYKLSILNIKNF